jgi:predicted glycosyltransferase
MQSEKRLCPICNEIIVGREDKKFCSTRCKNKFSNREVKKIYYAGKAALKGEPQTLKTVQIQEPKTIKILRPETKKIEVN